MMKTLDIDALLAKNPKVDRKEVRKHMRKDGETSPVRAFPVSPYAGRRLVVDDKSTLEDAPRRSRASYFAP